MSKKEMVTVQGTGATLFSHTGRIPENSMIQAGFGRVDYCDSCRITKPTAETVEQITAQLFTLPKWVRVLMKLRNRMVQPFGLQAGAIEDAAAPFPVIGRNGDEILMEGIDGHLNFRVSVLIDREQSHIFTTTLVHYNNRLGRLYFFFVKPFHQLIVRSMVKRLLKSS
jgi:hypothetical protein